MSTIIYPHEFPAGVPIADGQVMVEIGKKHDGSALWLVHDGEKTGNFTLAYITPNQQPQTPLATTTWEQVRYDVLEGSLVLYETPEEDVGEILYDADLQEVQIQEPTIYDGEAEPDRDITPPLPLDE